MDFFGGGSVFKELSFLHEAIVFNAAELVGTDAVPELCWLIVSYKETDPLWPAKQYSAVSQEH